MRLQISRRTAAAAPRVKQLLSCIFRKIRHRQFDGFFLAGMGIIALPHQRQELFSKIGVHCE